MTVIEAIVLGIVQGVTEFLPISSSGHLELTNALLGTQLDPKKIADTIVVLHFATALSTVVVFRRELLQIARELFQFKWNESSRFAAKIVLSMIPAAVVGVTLDEQIARMFGGQVMLIGTMLLLTGALLFLADRAKDTQRKVGFLDAVWIGAAQAIAILPGISRSGATISTAVLLGIDRQASSRFSFLMVLPLILGKMAKDAMSEAFNVHALPVVPLIVGFAAALATGLVACKWMLALVKRAQLRYFSIYCFIVGTIAIGYVLICK